MTSTRIVLLFAGLLVAGLVFLCINGLSDFDISGRNTVPVMFETQQGKLAGTLVLPETDKPFPVAVLVHGDGPADRFASDGYLPLMNALLDAGIGVFSWDKPGIGQSEGNWLDQSIQDRANEVLDALAVLRELPQLKRHRVGVLGFSQAGWVLPHVVAENNNPDFYVLVGGAVNWLRQGRYFTQIRLENANVDAGEIERQLAMVEKADALQFAPENTYQDYLALKPEAPVSRKRFGFIQRNMASDASGALRKMKKPFLVLHGDKDLNVNAAENQQKYRELLADTVPESRVELVQDASHTLLRAGLFNYQLSSQMPWWSKTAFALLGRHAYAPGALSAITGWISSGS